MDDPPPPSRVLNPAALDETVSISNVRDTAWRAVWISGALVLFLVAAGAVVVSAGVSLYLAGDPTPEEGGQCVGGHTVYAIALVSTAVFMLAGAASTLSSAIRARPAWRPAASSLLLLAVWIVIAVATPEFSVSNVGQC
jgi:hypothetical protein